MRKYFFRHLFRRDGSLTEFGVENKFGEFGAFSIAWILSEENYLKKYHGYLS